MKRIRGGVAAPRGFVAAGVTCGIKAAAKDLAILASEKPCVVAGVFTTNDVKAAPVQVTRARILRHGTAQAVVINSGNANCCTGKRGLGDAGRMAELCAKQLGVSHQEVLVASTGPIGKFLPMAKVEKGIAAAATELRKRGAADAAEAILTTDTVTKQIAITETVAGTEIRIGAMAKGAGMIEPNMATMLAFITTDAVITADALRASLKHAVDGSFNRITVDGDRSTNDMVIVLANGLAGNKEVWRGDDLERFQKALGFVCCELAKMIVRDGEGATKFVHVTVKGAPSARQAEVAARAVANSSLVKTALHGASPNWGRIMAALGYSGAKINPNRVDIYLGGIKVAARGQPADCDPARSGVAKALKRKEIQVLVDLNSGEFERTVWTCDFSAEYVAINV
ncbi:MAG: bifunctional glutamate N-acetyltransferase/amino-acid acetyltransferase ArgJ [bacterium]|nr:bifunctional glutamate N-acetyltransferase/amino-acid acetyltransferase ArgJ [bacterium]